MSTRIAQLYLSVPQSGSSIVTVQWDGARTLSLSTGQLNVGNIVRVDFYDSTGSGPLTAIACVPADSIVTLDPTTHTARFFLSLRCALAAAPDDRQPLDATVNASQTGQLLFTRGVGAGFSIGHGASSIVSPYGAGGAPVGQPLDYDSALAGLAYLDAGLTWIDKPLGNVNNSPSIFEQNTGCSFNTQHVSFHTRELHVPSGGTIPVLTLRRGFQQNGDTSPFPGPFSFDRFNARHDHTYHTVQFPHPNWFLTPPTAEPTDLVFETGEMSQTNVAAFYNDQIQQPYIGGLRIINATLPVSTLPTFDWLDQDANGQATPWHIVHDVKLNAATNAFTFSTERLLPAGYLDTEAGATPQPINVGCSLDAFRTHSGDALGFSATIAIDPATLAPSPSLQPTTTSRKLSLAQQPQLTRCMQIQLGSLAPFGLQMVRLGSLDLTFAGSLDGSSVLPAYRIDFDTHPAAGAGWLPRVYLKGALPVARYAPGGQDEPVDDNEFRITADPGVSGITGFTRSTPIVIDAGLVGGAQMKSTTSAAFSLLFDELTQPYPQPQQLALTLSPVASPDGTAASTPRVVVIDREPFFVAFVALDNPAGDNDTEHVGVWCNLYPEGPGWRLFAGAAGFNMFLPPQAVGEAMVKSPDDPALQAGQIGTPAPLIDYRFSPAFSARMFASYFAKNAVEPGWNSRRLLGYAGQQMPGALIDSNNGGAQFELLYGMTTRVTQPSLRLSEIAARLGNYPGPLPQLDGPATRDPEYTDDQRNAYDAAAQAWADLYAELIRRPSVLELWDVDNGTPDLVLDSGVSYSFRPEVFYTDPNDPKQPLNQKQPLLRGGVGYGIDSPNIRGEILTQPISTAGKLVSPRFTPLGGYGKQRAEFANGKVIIDSTTSLGRLESLTITLVGRIGVLYNHALHVTAYERTVEASDQFASEQPTTLSGRPMLRKTEEYVDILELNREYPEGVATDPTLAGFVRGSHFKSQRIYVDSNWGGDVGDIGWQVPLWKPGAVPAQVYPRPHIGLDVAVDPAMGINTVAGEISDPQKLCFYTDTRLGSGAGAFATANTDSWPAVPTIDYIDQPPIQQPLDQEPQGQPLRAGGQDPSVEPGFGRFTYHFVDSPSQVNLTSQRSKTAVGATLGNVSMMRTARAAQPGISPNVLQAQSLRCAQDWWTATRTHVEQGLAASQATADLAHVQTAVQQAKTYIGGLANEINSIPQLTNQACSAIQSRLVNAVNRVSADGQGFVKAILVQVPDRWLEELKKVTSTTANQYAKDLETKVQWLAADGTTSLQPAITALGNIIKQLNTYSTTLNSFEGGVDSAFAQANIALQNPSVQNLQTLLATLATISSSKPDSFRTQLDAAAATLASALQQILGSSTPGVIANIAPSLDLAVSQVNAAAVSAGAALTAALNSLNDALTDVQANVNSAVSACSSAINQLNTTAANTKQPLEYFIPNLSDNIVKKIEAVKTQGVQAIIDAATNALNTGTAADQINSLLQRQTDWITTQSSAFCSALTQDVNTALNQLKALAGGALQSLLNNLAAQPDLQAISNALQQLDTQINQQFAQISQQVVNAATTFEDSVAGAALHLLRAFGAPPVVPTMNFTGMDGNLPLPTMAFTFWDGLPKVDVTPAWTAVQQAADGLGQLQQLGIGMPTTQLLDRLLPASLQNYDLSSIFPHFAGLDLSQLFSGVTMPSLANDNVRITHHIDPQHKRASLDADIDVPFAGQTRVLDMGPVTLLLTNAEFQARVHCEVAVGQQVQQVSSGQITGDWQLLICGTQIVSFTRTTLSFDSSGHLHFDIQAPNVRLADVLQFLADMVNSISFGDSGFSIHASPDPVTVQCILDLPLPDMSAGAFGIQNLRFGALFEIGFDQSFYLGCGANLARKTEPFILTIFILGGAGWMEANLRYQNGKATGQITIGLAASASLAISLGPISGSVSIQFGVFAELAIGTGGGLQLGIMILVSGRVSLLGIIDASITLLLEAVYSSGGGLVGRGTVSVSIKICWCFTLKVHASVSYSFGKSGGSSHSSSVTTQMAMSAPVAPAPAVAPLALAAAPVQAPIGTLGVAAPAQPQGNAAAVPALPPGFADAKQAALAYTKLFV